MKALQFTDTQKAFIIKSSGGLHACPTGSLQLRSCVMSLAQISVVKTD